MNSLNKGIFAVLIATVVTSAMILLVDSSIAESKTVSVAVDTKPDDSLMQKKEINNKVGISASGVLPPPPGPFAKESSGMTTKSLAEPKEPKSPLMPTFESKHAGVKKPVFSSEKPVNNPTQPSLEVAAPKVESLSKPEITKPNLNMPASPKKPEKMSATAENKIDPKKPVAPEFSIKQPLQTAKQPAKPSAPVSNNAIKADAPIWSKGNRVGLQPPNPQFQNPGNVRTQQQYMYTPMPVNPTYYYPQNWNNMAPNSYYNPAMPQMWMPPVMPNNRYPGMNNSGQLQMPQVNQSAKSGVNK